MFFFIYSSTLPFSLKQKFSINFIKQDFVYQIYKSYNIYQRNLQMLQSSTPNGLAPLSATGVLIFTTTISFLFLVWGAFNLAMLLRISEEGQSAQRSQRTQQLTRKIFLGVLNVYKLDLAICLVAMLIFFLVIMGGVNHFESFEECLGYLFGGINAILCGLGSIFANRLVTSRILSATRYSKYDAYHPAKLSGNFQSFFFIGWTFLWISLALILYQFEHEQQLHKKQLITKITTAFLCFAFGSATVSIGMRICHSIYHKGAEMSMETLHVYEDRLPRNHKHPALIAKAVGQVLNKQVSSVVDTITFLIVTLACATHAAALHVIGTDQEGQIIFSQSYENIYLPVIGFTFAMIFIWIVSVGLNIILRPSTGDQIRTFFNLQRYTVIFFLIGFLALAAYLCLPAEFEIGELGEFVRHPYHAYLCLLFGLILSLLITLSGQLYSTHPFFVNTISRSCNTGSATNIIYGLSSGYLYNFIPTILLVGIGFLASYWIGTFGVGLVAVGFVLLTPVYLCFSVIYSSLENASYISYICTLDEGIISSLIDLSTSRKDFQPHIQTLFYGLACFLGYQQYLIFSESTNLHQNNISLNSPSIFLGILLGAMFPYLFSACLLRSINRSYLAIAYDIRNQIEEIPSMSQGGIDADFLRTNSLFAFQCAFSFKRFLLPLFYPFIILGIGTGPKPLIGFLIGAVISGIQLGISNGISGCLWSTVKKQINLGNLQDADMNPVKSDSEWGRAAQVGFQVGQPLKDGVNSGVHIILMYTGLLSCVLGPLFQKIHA